MSLDVRTLYYNEIRMITEAVSNPCPTDGKGYWISSSWLANAKLYYDALSIQDGDIKSSKARKAMKIRARRGSDALPPWPNINSEITCEHNQLSLQKNIRAKRKIITSRSWKVLRRFYPRSNEFRVSSLVQECAIFSCNDSAARLQEELRLRREKEMRQRSVPTALHALLMRKTGVPSSACAAVTRSNRDNQSRKQQPLVPGIYHLLPREWLRAWRQYLNDPTVASLPLLDCTSLLCIAHGLLVIPPHVEEYLNGTRKSLLQGLADYRGVVYEVLGTEEWDALSRHLDCYTDFNVRFSCDGERCSWSLGICELCDPYDRGDIAMRLRRK